MSHFSVTVFCGSMPGRSPEYIAAARDLGAGLAAHDMRLVFGGGNVGLMGALAAEAVGGGAHVTGIIPEFLRAREVEFEGLSELIVTDSMHTRKRRMFARADAFVVLPGGLGTMDELIEVLTWKQLGQHAKPIILCDIEGWARPVFGLIDHVIAHGFARPPVRQLLELVPDVPAVLGRLEAIRAGQSSASGSGLRSAVGNL